MRLITLALCLAAIGCSTPPRPNRMELDKENDKLLKLHREIWGMMGLSKAAQEELNAVVLKVNENLQHNRIHDPKKFAGIPEKRDPKWREQTRGDYFSRHKARFGKLGVSESTQKELFRAMEFVWKALHDAKVPEKDRQTARKIQEMMKQLPKCCDDAIFEKAASRKP